jgi:hypothetical protein
MTNPADGSRSLLRLPVVFRKDALEVSRDVMSIIL